MPIYKIILTYLLTMVVFFAIDITWIAFIAKDLYDGWIGHLRGPVNWPAAFIFYFLFIAGILIYAILPSIEKESWILALGYGVMFGFFTYATYDLTNLATLKDWPVKMVVIDILWGMFLSGSVATAGHFIGSWIK